MVQSCHLATSPGFDFLRFSVGQFVHDVLFYLPVKKIGRDAERTPMGPPGWCRVHPALGEHHWSPEPHEGVYGQLGRSHPSTTDPVSAGLPKHGVSPISLEDYEMFSVVSELQLYRLVSHHCVSQNPRRRGIVARFKTHWVVEFKNV